MDSVTLTFGIISAVANIIIATVAARGRFWERAQKMTEFMDELRHETSNLLSQMEHVTSSVQDLRAEYKDFTKTYSLEMRDLSAKLYEHDHRLRDIERRLNSK